MICSDKTGTLTRNEMTVRTVITSDKPIEVSGVGYRPEGGFELEGGRLVEPADDHTLLEAARAAILCNDAELRDAGGAWIAHGDPMEGALLSLGIKAGHDAGDLAQAISSHRRNSLRYPASIHGDAASQPCRRSLRLRQGCA